MRGENCAPITRARAAAAVDASAGAVAGLRKCKSRATKRSADELSISSAVQNKRRAVLGDVTNVNVNDRSGKENATLDCSSTGKLQGKSDKERSRNRKKDARALPVTNDVLSEILTDSVSQSSNLSESHRIDVNSVSDKLSLSDEGEGCVKEQTDIDIDAGQKDPQMCSTYVQDIYEHLRVSELKKKPKANFMETLQRDITPNMRAILVDWLVEVAEEYKLVPDTLYLTVGYIDRFLSVYPVGRHRLQLLGVSCMLIASKYEEICPPHVEEFCYITDNTYTREEMLSMERKILTFLHFEMTMPTIKTFLRRFVRASQVGSKVPSLELEFLSNYLAELTLLECNFLQYLPSLVAASAVFLSLLTIEFKTNPWNSTLQRYTGYTPSQLKECVTQIYDLQLSRKASSLMAIREKYRQLKFKRVAILRPPPFLPERFFEDIAV